jgi:hypothetical protein
MRYIRTIYRITFFTPLLLGLLSLVATAGPDSLFQVKSNSISPIRFYATNYGIFGSDEVGKGMGFYLPADTVNGNSYLFGSGIWFGAKKRVRDTITPLVFITYSSSGKSWGTPGEYNGDRAYPNLCVSTDYNHFTGMVLDTTLYPYGISNWPLWLLPGIKPQPMSPGIFEPDNAMRFSDGSHYATPAFISDVDISGIGEQFVSRFHDRDLPRYEIAENVAMEGGYPIGLQFQQNIYAWRWGDLKHVVLLTYDIINASSDTLYDCVAAQAADPDIGAVTDWENATNDHLAFYAVRPDLRTGLAWSDPDTSGTRYGALAMILIEAPMTDSNGFVDNARRMDYERNGRAGAFPNWTDKNDPHTYAERYYFLTSGLFGADDGPADQRALMASTPFNMRPGDTAHFAMAFAVVDTIPNMPRRRDDTRIAFSKGSGPGAPMLEVLVARLNNEYYHFTISNSVVPVSGSSNGASSLSAYPNPACDRAAVTFTLRKPTSAGLRLFNALGEVVMTRPAIPLDAGTHEARLDVTALPTGVYLIAVETPAGVSTVKLTVAR